VLGVPNVLAVSSEMSGGRGLRDHQARCSRTSRTCSAVHPAANQTTVEFTMAATPVPLHPGAIRYYEEIGADSSGPPARVSAGAWLKGTREEGYLALLLVFDQ
jgi:TRAP-type uncharacterized transport system substrate-binding protein